MTKPLAYFDSFSGLIPCRLLAIEHTTVGRRGRVQYTAGRGPFKRGQVETWSLRNIVPRSAVHVRSGQYRIWAYAPWADDVVQS